MTSFLPSAWASSRRAEALFGARFMYSFIFMPKRYTMYPSIASEITNCVVDSPDVKRIICYMKWYEFAKQLMKEQGLKQADLMPVFDVATRGAVGHYLSGRRSVTAEQFKALADRLGVSMDDLFSAKLTHPSYKEFLNFTQEQQQQAVNFVNFQISQASQTPEITPKPENKPLTTTAENVGGGG